jgi:hypothetical protein
MIRKEVRESIARVLRAIADEIDGAPKGLAQGIADVKCGRVLPCPIDLQPSPVLPFVYPPQPYTPWWQSPFTFGSETTCTTDVRINT